MKFGKDHARFLNNTMYKYLVPWIIFLVLGFIAVTYLLPSIGCDSGFYVKIAYDISRGLSFYKDMNVAYTPLAMQIVSVIFEIVPSAELVTLYSFVILLYFILSILFYAILDRLSVEKPINRFLSLLFLLLLFVMDGLNVQLEPFVLLFQFLAILLLYKWHQKRSYFWIFIAGLSTFLAFYSKQYGLSALFGFIWFIYFNRKSFKQFVTHITIFLLGFLIPILLVIIYFNQQQISVSEMIIRIIGFNYLAGKDIVTGIDHNFHKFIESIFRFLSEAPIVLFPLILVFQKNKQKLSHNEIFMILLIFGACLQLIFAGYRHYYQLLVPFCLMLVGLVFSHIETLKSEKFYRIFTVLCIASLIMATYILFDTAIIKHRNYKWQKQTVTILTKALPSGQKVYLQGVRPGYYFLCLYDSPDHKLLSYRFPEELNAKYIASSLPTGSNIIVDSNYYVKHESFQTGFIEKDRISVENGKTCIILEKN